MNQRAHIRRQVEMPAVLSVADQAPQSCRVHDFCLGGMLLGLDDESRSLAALIAVGDPVRITLQVQGLRGLRDVVLAARVMRREGDAIGVAFEAPNATDLLAVQNHVRALLDSAQSQDVKRKGNLSRAQATAAADRLNGLLREFLARQFTSFLPAAREALVSAADKASTNEAQHPFFEADKILGQQADILARSFVTRSCKKLENLAQGIGDTEEDSASGGGNRLSLVDKDIFEDWLTLKVMATRAESHFHEDLLHLQLRFDELFGIALSARRNPLHPIVICTAFGESLRLLPLKQKTDRIILAAFEEHVIQALGDLYRDANIALGEAGVLPDLDVGRYISERYAQKAPAATSPVPKPVPAVPPETPAAAASGAEVVDLDKARAEAGQQGKAGPVTTRTSAGTTRIGAGLAARQFALQQHIARHAYDTVRRLLSESSLEAARSRMSEGSAALSLPVADELRVEEALAALQRSLDAQSADDPLSARVTAAINNGGDQRMQVDHDVGAAIEVIHHLFEGIVDSPVLSQRVKTALKKLEVPFLRLLLVDDSFLTEEAHPARQMLNRMAHLGVRGSANLAAHEQEIDQEVEGVLQEFDRDVGVFSRSLEKLDKLAGRQQSLYQRNIKRVTEAYEGKQKLVLARREANQALERRIGGKQIPKAALSLIDAGWRQLLVQALLRHGRDSREWHGYLGVIDQLIKSVEKVPTPEQLSELLAMIKSGLGQVDHTQMQNARLISELRDLLSQKARAAAQPELVTVPAGVVGAEDDEVVPGDELQQRWMRRAQRVEVGDWFSYFDNGEEMTVRLAWADTDKRNFVFVNHQGMKIIELRLDEFAVRLSHEEMRPIDSLDAPAVDRGLENMVQRVYGQMAHQATHDDLTGLLNRREFERQLRQRLSESDQPGSLLHIDIDQFKVVNTYGGPEAGDDMIRNMANAISETFSGNPVARLNGDEFAVWLEGLSPEGTQRAAEAFSRRIAGERFSCAGKPYSVTVSTGIVNRSPEQVSATELLRAASTACHMAKESGRNRIQRYAPEDRELARRDDIMAWAAKLNEAIDQDRLALRCQRIEPTVPSAGDNPAYEVLISVLNDEGEFLAPSDFLHAAERYNRMHALDRWVVSNVLRWMHANPDVVRTLDHLSINLSGHSLNDTSLLEFLFDLFQRYPVPRERICFEVTETAAIANLEDAGDFIRELQELGCRFSLDDFGSGLASYGHLKHLPVDYIKIDGSFIRDIADDPADLALVRSINEMGHLMGKRTIAEYVENERIRDCLREIGVDFVQGFGVEKPRPLDSLGT